MKVFVKTPKSGAQTSIMLGIGFASHKQDETFWSFFIIKLIYSFFSAALDPKLENVSGKYFSDCAVASETQLAQDDETAAWLWEASEQITKLK